ncbi:MAG: electron transfer flavoprotein subunit beta/FixA family protein [Candidatus Limnocylindria bacterium]
MKLLVCLKQVPDSTVRVKVAPDGASIVTEGITWAISPYDEYAIELALERKDADPATTVSVVTVGPPRSRDALRQALAMGCDDATLVTAAEDGGALALARSLAAIVAEAKPDVVLCGKQASDDDQGLVGPALAEWLGWPHLPAVTALAPAGGGIEMWRETEGGHEVWRASGPVVITVQRSPKEPRYPSLPGIMKAKKKEIPERELASLGAPSGGPALEVLAMEPPPARGGGKILKNGDAAALAGELARLLRDEAKVL